MYKILTAAAILSSVLASSLLGIGGTTAAVAATSAKSWPANVIYVYDATAKIKKSDGSPVWPVSAAAERWDDGNPIDFVYTTKSCPAGAQCVTVRQAELAAPTVGVTATSRVGTDIKAVTITLDTTFGRTNSSARRRNVTCHELGHSLGLGHRSSKSSCLTSYAATQMYPDATDIKNLNTLYR